MNCKYFAGQATISVGDIIANKGVIVIGGEGHHIYQHDGKFAKHHNADEHN